MVAAGGNSRQCQVAADDSHSSVAIRLPILLQDTFENSISYRTSTAWARPTPLDHYNPNLRLWIDYNRNTPALDDSDSFIQPQRFCS